MLVQLIANKPLTAALVAWAIAQALKVPLWLFFHRGFDLKMLVSTGGMPSSHTAFVSALTWMIGLLYGWDSGLFAVSTVFAAIVMYDAAGIRRAAGKQAEVLNKIIEELQHHERIREEHLKELLGHTPIEVVAGAVLGITVAILLYR
ncbi:MAG: divergent PAP2 family protein [Chloroflexota bacterium]